MIPLTGDMGELYLTDRRLWGLRFFLFLVGVLFNLGGILIVGTFLHYVK